MTRSGIITALCFVFLAGCVPPTEPDTPRRRITEPLKYFLQTINLSHSDIGYDIVQLDDGGFIITGRTWMPHTASEDVLLLRTNIEGSPLWTKTFGGIHVDEAYSVYPTRDGGFVLAGRTRSFTSGLDDLWLIKTDSFGNMQWSTSHGGTGDDNGQEVIECRNGDFVVVGTSYDVSTGGTRVWLLRTDELGKKIWSYDDYGLGDSDRGYSVHETNDGGFVVIGSRFGFGNGLSTIWLFKVSASGILEWERSLRGQIDQTGFKMVEGSNGRFAIIGYSSPRLLRRADMLFLLVDSSGDVDIEKVLHQNAIGRSIAATPDGGYIVCGYTNPYEFDASDIVLVKLDRTGETIWKRIIGGPLQDWAMAVTPTQDGGYALTGSTRSFGNGSTDLLILKTDHLGFYE